jgi:ligand-binding sensor domain-containing protein
MPITLAALLIACVAASAAAESKWTKLTTEQGLPSDEIQFIKADDGRVWIGTLRGLVYYDGKLSPVLVPGQVWDVLPLDAKTQLVGTDRGATVINAARLAEQLRQIGDDEKKKKQAIKHEYEAGGTRISPLVKVDDDRIWSVQRAGGFDAGQTKLIERVDGKWRAVKALADRGAVDIDKGPDGRLYVTLDGDGVAIFNPKQGFDEFKHVLDGQNVTAMTVDKQGNAWFGLWGAGVSMLQGERWTDHLRDQEAYIFAIREDRKGNIWVATDQGGLWRYDGKQWVNDLKEEGGVNLLEVTRDGRVWISTQSVGGLRYYDPKNQKWVTAIPGPLPIRSLTETDKYGLWAGGVLDGVHILPPEN